MSCNFLFYSFLKGEEEDPGNFTPVSPTSILEIGWNTLSNNQLTRIWKITQWQKNQTE